MKIFRLNGASILALVISSTIGSQAIAQNAETGASDIIVTATKREQSLINVPISVAVTSSDTIEKAQIRDLIDLQTVVPSLIVTEFQNTGATTFAVRGFGNGDGNIGIEPSVGVFIDGVYRSRSASSMSNLDDIERIEVLRGPQSTLFGKNVSAGAISITTKAPAFKWGLSAEMTAGNYGEIAGKAAVNAPLGEKAALRVSGSFEQRDGYYNNLVTGHSVNNRNRWSVRGDLLLKPTDRLSVRIIADYNKIDEACCGAVSLYNGPATQLIGAPVAYGGLGKPITNTSNLYSYNVVFNTDPRNKLIGQGISGEIDYHLNAAKLVSITSYREQTNDVHQDVDFTGADLATQDSADKIKTFTQEFRISSDSKGPLTWLLGAFYSNENVTTGRNLTYGADTYQYLNTLASGNIFNLEKLEYGAQGALYQLGLGGPPTIIPGHTYFQNGQGISDNWQMKDDSYSIFGQFDYKLMNKLTFTGGAAYIHDSKSVTSAIVLNDPFSSLNLNNIPLLGILPLQLLNPAAPAGAKIPVNTFAGLAPFQFFVPPVPQFNTGQAITVNGVSYAPTLSSSKVTFNARLAYEVSHNINIYASYTTGYKAGTFNLSSDYIKAGVGVVAQPEKVQNIEVGLKARFHGGYLNVAVFQETINNFQLNPFLGTGYGLNNAGKESSKGFEFEANYKPISQLALSLSGTYLDAKYDSFPNAACASYVTLNPCSGAQVTHDISGSTPAGIPKWSVTASGTYTQPLGGGYFAFLRGEYDYVANTQLVESVPAPYGVAGVHMVNASLGLNTPYKLDVTLWGRNLNNDQSLLSTFPSVIQAGSYSGYLNAPRTYGITLRKKF